MTVRRLTQWTKQLCLRLAARLGLATTPTEPEREPVLSGSSARMSAKPGYAGTITATHWLDDARRMRPRRVRSIPLPQPAGDEIPQEKPTRPHVDSTVVRAPSPVKSPNSAPLPVDRPARTASCDTQPHRPEMDPELAPSTETPAMDDIDDKLRRRLRSLQFLVRHGVYNEGFTRGALPDQYRRSAGLGDDGELPL